MTLKLKPEFKAKWLEALRSGKYAQTKNFLFVPPDFSPEEIERHKQAAAKLGVAGYPLVDVTPGGYCCLGVATKVEKRLPLLIDLSTYTGLCKPESALIGMHDGEDVFEWFDVEVPDDYEDEETYHELVNEIDVVLTTLSAMNDQDGKTFAQIADYIEAEL